MCVQLLIKSDFVFRYYMKLAEKMIAAQGSGLMLVLVPLVPLLEEALAGSIASGLRASHIRDAPHYPDELYAWMRGRVVFCSLESAASSAHRLFSCADGLDLFLIVDEAHMVTLDMGYRPDFRSAWALGSCFGPVMNTLLLTATLRPALEADVIFDLGLEESNSFSVIRCCHCCSRYTRYMIPLTPAPQISQ